MSLNDNSQKRDRWARLRFAIIGPLLAAPPTSRGELRQALKGLTTKNWTHPGHRGLGPFRFCDLGTLVLCRPKGSGSGRCITPTKNRCDSGRSRRLPACLVSVIKAQYQAHPSWTVQLHYDNLAVQVTADEALGLLPSYGTIRRYMKAPGLSSSSLTPKHRQRLPNVRHTGWRVTKCAALKPNTRWRYGIWIFIMAPTRY